MTKLIALLCLVAFSSAASANCLKEVADFAESICGQIQSSGNRNLTEADGKLKAEVSGIVRKVVGDAAGNVNVKKLSDAYENVLREDLAKELFNVRECRMKMAQVGRDEACKKPSPTAQSSLSRTCQYISGPKRGTKQYFPPEASIVPALIGQPCHDAQGSSGYAIKDE